MQLLLPVLLTTAATVSAANNFLRYDDGADAKALHMGNEETRQFLGDAVRELAGEHLPLLVNGQRVHIMQGNGTDGGNGGNATDEVSKRVSGGSPRDGAVPQMSRGNKASLLHA